jgi:HYDIN/CFA65/VesB-like, Ig-like domain
MITAGKLLMHIKLLQALVVFFCMTAILLQGSESYPASSEDGPIIQIRQTSHAFSPVFEGEKLSHTFTVFNKGNSNLNIKEITSS